MDARSIALRRGSPDTVTFPRNAIDRVRLDPAAGDRRPATGDPAIRLEALLNNGAVRTERSASFTPQSAQ